MGTAHKSRTVDVATLLIVLFSSVRLFLTPLHGSADILAYAQDDFYYYLVVARNLVRGLGSTFDGSTLTNGYHPLYLVVLWVACHFATTIRGVFKFLALLDTASAMAIFLASRAFFRRHLESPWLVNALALGVLGLCVQNIYDHMEVTLTLPLGMLFLLLMDRAPEELSNLSWAGIGLTASLLFLSRLDSALWLALCGLMVVSVSQYRREITWSKLLAFGAGFAPLTGIYLGINEYFFHRLSPISGAAKQLRTRQTFNWHPRMHDQLVNRSLFVISLFVLLYVFVRWSKVTKQERVIYTAAALFPFVHWGLNLLLSDWQIWPWYSYSLRFVLLSAFAIIGVSIQSLLSPKRRFFIEPAFYVLSLLVLLHKHYKLNIVPIEIAAAAHQISTFAQTHPGLYAMGDRAGMVGYLNAQPTLQTEGLMMDNGFLEHIKHQDPLLDVLKLYHVDYYVGFSEKLDSHWTPVTGCFQAKEPAQAGPNSDSMRATLCEPPNWKLIQSRGETMIFDLRPKTQP